VVAVAALLRFYRLGDGGLGNPFYAATVRSMLHSLHNSFFVSFDPYGTFMADKPPLDLWLQTLSAFILGFRGLALMLPQALAGVAAVALLLVVARRLHGDTSALAAAVVLATLPVSVLTSRNNTMDTLLVALSLAAIALTVRAVERGSPITLAAAATVMGLAFNVKEFEGLLALPGLALYYWLASATPAVTRVWRLAGSGIVLLVVGLSWTFVVGLVPSEDHPIVLNSDGNSIWSLTFGYNGFDRVLGGKGFNPATALTAQPGSTTVPIGVFYGGERGPLRLFGEFPGPLVAAAVPAALAGVVLLGGDFLERRRRAPAVIWLAWLGAGVAAFSASRLGSSQYLEAFSPPLAVCTGTAAAAGLRDAGWRRVCGLAGVACSAAYMALRFSQLGDAGVLTAACGVGGAVAALAAIASPATGKKRATPWLGGVAAGLVACGTLVMSAQAVRDAPVEGVWPGAVFLSEDKSRDSRFDPGDAAYYPFTGQIAFLDRSLDYLEARHQDGGYLVAVRSFYVAAAVISQRDQPVLPLYSEFLSRREYPIESLRRLLDEGRVEYFMLSLPLLKTQDPEIADLIARRCPANVSREAGLDPRTGFQLYHCR